MVAGGEQYGSVGVKDWQGRRRGQTGDGMPRARTVVVFAVCMSGLAMLLSYQAGGHGMGDNHAVVLEEEVGSFGTALNQRQVHDADAEFEDRFQDDPGHVSRGEIRFNAALHDMGGRNPNERRRHYREVERRPNLRAQWTAIREPEVKQPSKVAVNIVAAAPAPAVPNHMGMSDSEARNDLNSYFSTLSQQVKSQEKKHAEQVLGELSGSSSTTPTDDSSAGMSSTRQSLGVVTFGQKVADQKVSALMKLVKKAAASKKFQEALVDASRDTFRKSVVSDFE